MPRTYTHSPEDDAILLLTGKAYGISISFWKKFFDFLADGPALAELQNTDYLSREDKETREDYKSLVSLQSKIPDILDRKPIAEVARLLTAGRDALRSSEVHTVSKDISLWPTGYKIPGQKRVRGIGDDVCGALLCPPSRDWNDPDVRQAVRNHTIPFEADDFPCFLWQDETADLSDLKKGFLRGSILTRTVLCILLGPAVALTGEGSGAGGYADKMNMRSITIPSIAFAAAVARHALTADTKFSWTNSSRFDYLHFYHTIIKSVLQWPETDRTQLLEWWNGQVISRLPGRSRASPSLHHPRPGSLAALMRQQQD